MLVHIHCLLSVITQNTLHVASQFNLIKLNPIRMYYFVLCNRWKKWGKRSKETQLRFIDLGPKIKTQPILYVVMLGIISLLPWWGTGSKSLGRWSQRGVVCSILVFFPEALLYLQNHIYFICKASQEKKEGLWCWEANTVIICMTWFFIQ